MIWSEFKIRNILFTSRCYEEARSLQGTCAASGGTPRGRAPCSRPGPLSLRDSASDADLACTPPPVSPCVLPCAGVFAGGCVLCSVQCFSLSPSDKAQCEMVLLTQRPALSRKSSGKCREASSITKFNFPWHVGSRMCPRSYLQPINRAYCSEVCSLP